MRWNELEDEVCSVARTLSVVGDRWTLLILRDCFMRVRRFEEFQSRLGIGRPILTDRLQKLVDDFILTKVPYQQNPLRYEYRLTPKGLTLHPIMMSLVHWGDVQFAGKRGRPVLHKHLVCGCNFDPVMTCSECGGVVEPRDVEVIPGPGQRAVGRSANPAKATTSRKPKTALRALAATPAAEPAAAASAGRRRTAKTLAGA